MMPRTLYGAVELDLCRENEPAVDTSVGAGESFVQPGD
jgi:hypothetical protein